jgi:integrase
MRRNAAGWAVALALGLRQGEALGLKWPDINLDRATLRVRRELLRPRYRHGCGDTCGRKKAGYCSDRIRTNALTKTPGPAPARARLGYRRLWSCCLENTVPSRKPSGLKPGTWRDEEWVFATLAGGPLSLRTDYSEWKRLLESARLRESRLHDARHTAATVLLILGQPQRTVMSLMGWSTSIPRMRQKEEPNETRTETTGAPGGTRRRCRMWQNPWSGWRWRWDSNPRWA